MTASDFGERMSDIMYFELSKADADRLKDMFRLHIDKLRPFKSEIEAEVAKRFAIKALSDILNGVWTSEHAKRGEAMILASEVLEE